jgi:hypothetical protein
MNSGDNYCMINFQGHILHVLLTDCLKNINQFIEFTFSPSRNNFTMSSGSDTQLFSSQVVT